MLRSYPDAPFLSRCSVPIRMRRSYPDAPFLSRCSVPIRMQRHETPPGPSRASRLGPAGGHLPPRVAPRVETLTVRCPAVPSTSPLPRKYSPDAPPESHTPGAHPAQLRLVAATGAYKTRPDQPVRARNVFGSGVRTLAVVRAVLTTIATLTTPLRHVILLEFVV